MCLTIPVRVVEVKRNKAVINLFGKKQEVDIQLVKVKKGDYGLISNGFLIKKISVKEAEKIINIIGG